jgi:hypothetical protein
MLLLLLSIGFTAPIVSPRQEVSTVFGFLERAAITPQALLGEALNPDSAVAIARKREAQPFRSKSMGLSLNKSGNLDAGGI